MQFDAVDLRGVPYVSKGETFWALSSWLPNVERDGEFGILFLDELFLAIPSVQAAALQLILDRRLGDYVLPDGWYVVSASNRPEDRAGVMAQNSALCNRFQHREAILSVDAWIEWAIEKGLRPEVIAFIRFRGENLLHETGSRRAPCVTPALALGIGSPICSTRTSQQKTKGCQSRV